VISLSERPLPGSTAAATDTSAAAAEGLHDSKQLQDDQDDNDDDQGVNPIAGTESWVNVPAQKAEQPEDEQNNDDGP
jgi:hypothetical protein